MEVPDAVAAEPAAAEPEPTAALPLAVAQVPGHLPGTLAKELLSWGAKAAGNTIFLYSACFTAALEH